MATPEAIRERAVELFDAQHPRRGRRVESNLRTECIAEIPYLPGQVMRVELIEGRHDRADGRRRSFLSFRAYVVEPGGNSFPSRAGFTISCDALPNLAFALAKAMEVERDAMPKWAAGDRR